MGDSSEYPPDGLDTWSVEDHQKVIKLLEEYDKYGQNQGRKPQTICIPREMLVRVTNYALRYLKREEREREGS